MTVASRLFAALVIVSTLAGCATEERADSQAIPADRPVTRLVDSTETEQYEAYKVEVRFAGRVDTIPGILTFDLPAVTADGLLHGAIYTTEGDYEGVYSYDPRNRALARLPLPSDAARWDSEIKLSPDAAHIAYIGSDSTGSQGIVRTWPAAAVVLTTMKARQPGSDHSSNQVSWVNDDSVEFSWHVDLAPQIVLDAARFQYLAIYAYLPAKRFTVDTLEKEPNLRRAGEPNSGEPR